MRGKPRPYCCCWRITGLIPACAGKTIAGFDESEVGRAHPRVCGENIDVNSNHMPGAGSSPRVRGKLATAYLRFKCPRLIPACAGKTRLVILPPRLFQAHPRVCGENEDVDVNTTTAAGSSPRVRGKLALFRSSRLCRRLIPACAGKTR